MKLRQRFCRHDWRWLEKNSVVTEVLYKCTKCKLYFVWHMGINCSYKTDEYPLNTGWEGKDAD